MSFGWSAATWMAVSVATTTAASLYSANQAAAGQNRALQQAKKTAQAQQLASDEANNKANAKSPNVAALMSANVLNARNGQAGTMLTGPGGLDPSAMTLGKTTLLGA